MSSPQDGICSRKRIQARHDRDGSRGLSGIVRDVVKTVPAWEGQAQTLVPPPLTAVGDRMLDGPLALSIKGEQKPRMTWLKARMPKFSHSKGEASAIVAQILSVMTGSRQHPGDPGVSDSPGHHHG